MKHNISFQKLDFSKLNGLIPAIVQHAHDGTVLMLGFMNAEALKKTEETGLVTFFSRSKQRLWTKGESSGNFLHVQSIHTDCDFDSLLIQALPDGPVCHTGEDVCFFHPQKAALPSTSLSFLTELEDLLKKRKNELPEGSYTSLMFQKGTDKLAQKVGEEAIETVIAAKNNLDELRYESSDLLFHLLMLLVDRELPLSDLVSELKKRHQK